MAMKNNPGKSANISKRCSGPAPSIGQALHPAPSYEKVPFSKAVTPRRASSGGGPYLSAPFGSM